MDSTDVDEHTPPHGATATGHKSAARIRRKRDDGTNFQMIPGSPTDRENSSPAGKCILSRAVEIEGSIRFQKELFIDGKVHGQINSDGVLTIGEHADVRGEIKSKSVTLYGKVHANITAERCELKSNCALQGDLKAAQLIVEDGAAFVGSSQNTLAERRQQRS